MLSRQAVQSALWRSMPPTLLRSSPGWTLPYRQKASFHWGGAPQAPEEASSPSKDLSTPSTDLSDSLSDTLSSPLAQALTQPGMIDSLATTLTTLPVALGISHAWFIPIATVALRLFVTLPLTLWQRKQSQYHADVVAPVIGRASISMSYDLRAKCRKEKKSYEEFKALQQRETKKIISTVHRQYRSYPLLTMLLPPAVHIPVLIAMSMVIRRMSDLGQWAVLSDAGGAASATLVASLKTFATTGFLWCPSLVTPDPTSYLPILVGVVTFANAEVNNINRLRMTRAIEERESVEDLIRKEEQERQRKREIVRQPSRIERGRPALNRRKYSVQKRKNPREGGGATENEATQVQPKKESKTSRRGRIMTNMLRLMSLALIPIASIAPSSVVLYWISSNTFTLLQSIFFLRQDHKRHRV